MNTMMNEIPPRLRAEWAAGEQARAAGEPPPVDLRLAARTLWQGGWIIVLCCIAALVAGLLAVSSIETTYTASSEILILVDEPAVSPTEGDTTLVLDDQRLATEVEILNSVPVLGAVVDRLGLRSDPAVIRRLVREPTRLARLAGRIPGPLGDMLDGSSGRTDATPRMLAIQILREDLAVRQVGESRVVALSYTADDPVQAARIVNAVADAYIEYREDVRGSARERRLEWLEERGVELRASIQDSEDAVEARRAELLVEAGQGLEITQSQLDAQAAALSEAQERTASLALLRERLEEVLAGGDGALLPAELRADETIAALQDEVSDLEARLRRLDEGSPARVSLEERLLEARERIGIEAERVLRATEADLRAAGEREERLTESVRALEDRALRQARAELDLRQLELETEVGRQSYQEVMRQLMETSGRAALTQADVRVLSPAEPPQFRDGRGEKLILLLALVTGAFAGAGLVVMRDQLNGAVRSRRQLEEVTGLPVLGSIPRVKGHRDGEVLEYMRRRPYSSLAEAVRSLCTVLVAPEGGAPAQVVVLTSTSVEAGQSTTALLAALGFARLGRGVIVVECDVRRPRLAALLGESAMGPGLQSVIDGHHDLKDAIHTRDADGFAVLPAGTATEEGDVASDALYSERFREVIDALRRRYDVVILNAPPALLTADARIVSRLADAVLLVLRWNRTPRAAALEAITELQSAGAPLRGAVLTVVNERKALEAFPGGEQRRRAHRLGYFRN